MLKHHAMKVYVGSGGKAPCMVTATVCSPWNLGVISGQIRWGAVKHVNNININICKQYLSQMQRFY
jgi:hypothetical protein